MRAFLCFIFTFVYCCGFSQSIRKVKAEYTYNAPENQSLEEAKNIALQRAKMQSIANEFGTLISTTNYTDIRNNRSHSSIDFQSIGMSDLRGEWIETIKDPVYDVSYIDGMQVVCVSVAGKIREIKESYANLSIKLLRNETDIKFESSEFKNNDDLFLHFISPISGFLSVYLIDDSDSAYCLLPYARQSNGIFPIVANKEYIFFNKRKSDLLDKTIVDEYVMTCGKTPEINKIAIIFSENYFVKSADFQGSNSLPRHLTTKDFYNWVAKSRGKDLKMQYQELSFIVKP